MSRAVDAVPTLARNSLPIRCSQRCANWRYRSSMWATPAAAVVGVRFPAVGVEFGVGAAAQFGCGVPDAAGVEADQVEPATNVGVGERGAHARDGVDRRRPWSARVHHQHPDAVTGCGYSDHRQLRLCAFGIGVVDREPPLCRTVRSGCRWCRRRTVRSRPRPAVDRRSRSTAPSGVADAVGHATPATSTHASSVAPPLPTRHMAVIVARASRPDDGAIGR